VFKRIIAPLALVLAIAGATLAIAPVSPPAVSTTTAVAQMPPVELVSFSSCPAFHACMFDGTNGSGAMLDLPFSTSYPGCHNLSGTWNDRASSLIVGYGSGAYMRFWLDSDCHQSALIASKMLGPNQSVADLSQEKTGVGNGTWNNVITSYAVYLP